MKLSYYYQIVLFRLVLGDSVSIDVSLGTSCGFLQELVSIQSHSDSRVTVLGQVTHRLLCTPDFEHSLSWFTSLLFQLVKYVPSVLRHFIEYDILYQCSIGYGTVYELFYYEAKITCFCLFCFSGFFRSLECFSMSLMHAVFCKGIKRGPPHIII